MSRTIHIDYGRSGLDVLIPDEFQTTILNYGNVESIDDPSEAVLDSLRNPIQSKSLAELAKGKNRCCIVVSDKTRPVPNPIILPAILKELNAAGLRDGQVTILVGTGIHAPTTGQALEEMLGPEILRRCCVVNHESRNPEHLVSIGRTSEGIEVLINRIYAEADLKIVTGLIEPHFMAGYSGGRKGICPAICSYETVKHFHSVARLSHPNATTGEIAGNPVHAMALEAAQMAGADFIVNVTLDTQRRITAVFAGDLVAAHEAGVTFLQSYAKALAPEPADVVLTSSAGYPLDTTFYQAIKGMVGGCDIVKPGGTVIVAAECAEGEGSPEFIGMLDHMTSSRQIMDVMRAPGFYQVDQWNVQELCKALDKAEVYFVTGNIRSDRLRQLCLKPFIDVETALAAALAKHGSGATLAVIPKGPYVEAKLK